MLRLLLPMSTLWLTVANVRVTTMSGCHFVLVGSGSMLMHAGAQWDCMRLVCRLIILGSCKLPCARHLRGHRARESCQLLI